MGRLNPQPFREVKRQRGSHVKFARRFGEVVDIAIVRRKINIPVGTLRGILSQAHIDVEEWDRLV